MSMPFNPYSVPLSSRMRRSLEWLFSRYRDFYQVDEVPDIVDEETACELLDIPPGELGVLCDDGASLRWFRAGYDICYYRIVDLADWRVQPGVQDILDDLAGRNLGPICDTPPTEPRDHDPGESDGE